jgi:hypothetical protein
MGRLMAKRGTGTSGPKIISVPGHSTWELIDEVAAKLSDPGSDVGRRQRAALVILLEHNRDDALPTSNQFIWYELEQAGVVDKNRRRNKPGMAGKKGEDQYLSEAITDLRERAIIPWDWIADETRSLDDYAGRDTILTDALQQVANHRLHFWGDEPAPLLLCESRSLAGVLAGTASVYNCSLTSTNGQVGGYLHTKVQKELRDNQRVLFLGDWDGPGADIETNTRKVLAGYHPHLLRPDRWERIALTEAQVRTHKLPVIVKKDGRHKARPCCAEDGPGHQAVETEALSQSVIVGLVRARLDALLLPDQLPDLLATQRRQRDALTNYLADYPTEDGYLYPPEDGDA